MIKAVIFDMGGVVLQNKSETVYRRLSEKLGIETDSFMELQEQCKGKMMRGELSAKEFAEIIKKKFSTNTDIIREWKEAYIEVMTTNGGVLELAERLKKNYRVALITNAPELHIQINKERGLYSRFDPHILSCEVGMSKSQKEIFDLVLEKLGLGPEECVFIDDRGENLQIPEGMGFHVIHFKDNKQLEESFRKLDLDF